MGTRAWIILAIALGAFGCFCLCIFLLRHWQWELLRRERQDHQAGFPIKLNNEKDSGKPN
jgi:hypothetical protein